MSKPYQPESVLDLDDALLSEWEQISAAGSVCGGQTETSRGEAVNEDEDGHEGPQCKIVLQAILTSTCTHNSINTHTHTQKIL